MLAISAPEELFGRANELLSADTRSTSRPRQTASVSRETARSASRSMARSASQSRWRASVHGDREPLTRRRPIICQRCGGTPRPIRDRHPTHVKQRVFHVKQEGRLLDRWLEVLLGRPGALASTGTGDPLPEGPQSYVSAAEELLGRYAGNVPPTSNSECFT